MRLKLDFEDVRFVTTRCEQLGDVRWLIVTINGKQFYVQRRMQATLHWGKNVESEIDRLLIGKMEAIMGKVLAAGAAAIPDGPIDV